MTTPPTDREIYERILEEERELRFETFGPDDAWQLGTILVGLAREVAAPLAIGIRLGVQRMFHAALPGATADNDAWIERKALVVEHYGHASLAIGARYRAEGRDFDVHSRRDPHLFGAFGGAFPLRIGDTIVGVVGVSGLPQEDDHALVVRALRALRASTTG